MSEMIKDNMTSDEIFNSDKDFIYKLVDEFFDKHQVNTKKTDCILARLNAEMAIDLFLNELYLKGHRISDKEEHCPLIRDGGCGVTSVGLYKGCTSNSPKVWSRCLDFGKTCMRMTGKSTWCEVEDKQTINKLRQLTEEELLNMGERE